MGSNTASIPAGHEQADGSVWCWDPSSRARVFGAGPIYRKTILWAAKLGFAVQARGSVNESDLGASTFLCRTCWATTRS